METNSIGLRTKVLGLYLFGLLFFALWGNYLGLLIITKGILWVAGPIVALYILFPFLVSVPRLPTEYWRYAFLILIAFIGFPFNGDTVGFFRYAQVLVSNFILMMMVYYSISSMKDLRFVWLSIWAISVVIGAFSFFIVETLMMNDEFFRLSGLAGNANGTANYCRVGIMAGLISIEFSKRNIFKIAIWLSIAFLSYIILVTASRGTFLNLVFILGAYTSLRYFNGIRAIIAILLLLIVGNFLLTFLEELFKDFYLFDRFSRVESLENAFEQERRLQLYQIAWDTFKQNPIFGTGLNQFRFYSGGKISHTDILDILVQLGAIGGLVYLSLYLKLFFRMFNQRFLYFFKKLDQWYYLWMIIFVSEMVFGLSNPNWFSQIQMVILSLLIVMAVKGQQFIGREVSN